MDSVLVLNNSFVTAYYVPTGNYLHHTFHQPVTGKRFEEIMTSLREAFALHKATGWLSDDRKLGEGTPEQIEWSLKVHGPLTVKAGWKTWAIVAPNDVMGRADMSEVVMAYYELGVRVQVFVDLEEARTWLIAVQQDE